MPARRLRTRPRVFETDSEAEEPAGPSPSPSVLAEASRGSVQGHGPDATGSADHAQAVPAAASPWRTSRREAAVAVKSPVGTSVVAPEREPADEQVSSVPSQILLAEEARGRKTGRKEQAAPDDGAPRENSGKHGERRHESVQSMEGRYKGNQGLREQQNAGPSKEQMPGTSRATTETARKKPEETEESEADDLIASVRFQTLARSPFRVESRVAANALTLALAAFHRPLCAATLDN